jgi:hypothetical protein
MRNPWSHSSRINRLIRGIAVSGAFATVFALAPGLHAQTSPAATSRSLLNSARASAGLKPLGDDSRLDAIAQAQAQRMADRDAIYHNPNLKSDADAAGVNWETIGENVGVGPDASSVHQAFMASPGHRQNILYGDYTVVGIGYAVGKDGSVFIAQDYAGLAASTPPPAPRPVVESAAPAPVAAAPAVSSVHAAAPVRTVEPSAAPRVEVAANVVAHGDGNALTGGVVNEVVRL